MPTASECVNLWFVCTRFMLTISIVWIFRDTFLLIPKVSNNEFTVLKHMAKNRPQFCQRLTEEGASGPMNQRKPRGAWFGDGGRKVWMKGCRRLITSRLINGIGEISHIRARVCWDSTAQISKFPCQFLKYCVIYFQGIFHNGEG